MSSFLPGISQEVTHTYYYVSDRPPLPITGRMVIKYVPHHQIERHHELGWYLLDSFHDCHHGEHAVMMAWLCDCKYVEPVNA